MWWITTTPPRVLGASGRATYASTSSPSAPVILVVPALMASFISILPSSWRGSSDHNRDLPAGPPFPARCTLASAYRNGGRKGGASSAPCSAHRGRATSAPRLGGDRARSSSSSPCCVRQGPRATASTSAAGRQQPPAAAREVRR